MYADKIQGLLDKGADASEIVKKLDEVIDMFKNGDSVPKVFNSLKSGSKVTGSFSDETLQHASKHLSGGSGKTTFKVSTLDELTSLTDEVLSVASDSNVTMQGTWRRVDVDMGRVIGTNGETSIRIIIDENGIIRTIYSFK